jgi:hypothetical protein
MRKILYNAICMEVYAKKDLSVFNSGPLLTYRLGRTCPPQPSYWSLQTAISPLPSEVPKNYLT